MQNRDVEECAPAKFSRVVENEIFEIENGLREADVESADFHVHAGRFSNLFLGDVSDDFVFEEDKRDDENDREDQQSKGPAKDKFDHTLGGPLQFNVLRQNFQAFILVLPHDRRVIV